MLPLHCIAIAVTGGSAAREQTRDKAPLTPNLALVSGAPLRTRHSAHDLVDVLTAPGPRCLATCPTPDGTAHWFLLLVWSLESVYPQGYKVTCVTGRVIRGRNGYLAGHAATMTPAAAKITRPEWASAPTMASCGSPDCPATQSPAGPIPSLPRRRVGRRRMLRRSRAGWPASE